MKLNQVKFSDINGRKHRQYIAQRTGENEYIALDTYSNMVVGFFVTSQESEEFLRSMDEEVLDAQRACIAKLVAKGKQQGA